MDLQRGGADVVEHHIPGSHRRDPTRSERVEDGDLRVRGDGSLRRGHSDGDVLSRPPNLFNEQPLANGETWMDFLRHSGAGRDEYERAQIAISRAAMMSADRRRRLTDQQAESTRRRSSSNILFGQLASGRRRSGMPYPANDHSPAFFPAQDTTDSVTAHRVLDRSLPRRPSISVQRSIHDREVNLPKWQPDAEVTKCPICGTPFSFWYRKHHCRKCGRVVCANCSPHRITIPRQYIVHPPEQTAPASTGADSSIEVVDLTGDNGENIHTPSRGSGRNERRQSHDHRIDPALGGGQEVRLCNPCVPDPNPLPHLYPSPARFSLDSLSRPDSIGQSPSSSIAPPRRSSIQHRLPPLPPEPLRVSPSSHAYELNRNLTSEARLLSSIGAAML